MAGSIALACGAAGAAVAWIVPTYRNSRPIWRFTKAIVTNDPRIQVSKSDLLVSFPGGGRLGIYTADSDVGIRGEAFHLAIEDESARISEETHYDVILPTLADHDGALISISTPKGRNWFWREFQRGLGDKRDVAAFTAPSCANPLPNIQKAYRLARQRVSSRTFAQEWDAQFLEDGAGVFRRVSESATAPVLPLSEMKLDGQYIVGVDWGRSYDATVFCVIDIRQKPITMVWLDRMLETDYHLQMGRLKVLAKRFKPAAIIAEQNAMGGPIIEQLQRDGLPVQAFVTTNATKAQIVDRLALAFERGDLRILPDPVLIGELQAYESDTLPSGLVRYGAPEGMHDDCVMALALAYGTDYVRWAGAYAGLRDDDAQDKDLASLVGNDPYHSRPLITGRRR